MSETVITVSGYPSDEDAQPFINILERFIVQLRAGDISAIAISQRDMSVDVDVET